MSASEQFAVLMLGRGAIETVVAICERDGADPQITAVFTAVLESDDEAGLWLTDAQVLEVRRHIERTYQTGRDAPAADDAREATGAGADEVPCMLERSTRPGTKRCSTAPCPNCVALVAMSAGAPR